MYNICFMANLLIIQTQQLCENLISLKLEYLIIFTVQFIKMLTIIDHLTGYLVVQHDTVQTIPDGRLPVPNMGDCTGLVHSIPQHYLCTCWNDPCLLQSQRRHCLGGMHEVTHFVCRIYKKRSSRLPLLIDNC